MTRLTFNQVQALATEASYTVEKLTRGYILYLEMNECFIEHDKFNTLAEVVEAINNGVLLCGSQCLLPIVEPSFTPEHEQLVDNPEFVMTPKQALATANFMDEIAPDHVFTREDEPEQGYPDEPQSSVVLLDSEQWTAALYSRGYCVGFAEVTKRVPRKVSKRAQRFHKLLAA